jgi:hypothetical protein
MANEGRVTSALKRLIVGFLVMHHRLSRYCQAHAIRAERYGAEQEQLDNIWNIALILHFQRQKEQL